MGHKWLAATSTSWLGESGLAGSEVAARCARIATGSETTPASVAKAGLAAIGVAITAESKTTITAAVVTASETATFS
ncbi:MAG: hypothetical protein KKG12_11920, partial [Gammaproteobacteria bacterium]|nr:hypothetical protein [Gammaproteobacteria bacterium]